MLPSFFAIKFIESYLPFKFLELNILELKQTFSFDAF